MVCATMLEFWIVPKLLGNLHYPSIAKGQSSMLVLEKFVDVHLLQRPSGFWRKERGAPLIHLQSLCTSLLHITYCTMGIRMICSYMYLHRYHRRLCKLVYHGVSSLSSVSPILNKRVACRRVMLLAKILHLIAPLSYQSLEAGILGRPGWVVLHVTHLCAQRMLDMQDMQDMQSTQAKALKTRIIVWSLHDLAWANYSGLEVIVTI